VGRIRGSDNTVEANIDLGVVGSKETQKELAQTNALVGRIGSEIDAFAKKGGFGRLSVGTERVRASETALASLGLQLEKNELKARELRAELAKPSDELTRPYRDVRDELVQVEDTVANLQVQIAKIPVELRESGRAAIGFIGDIDTGAQTLAGTLNSIGGAGVIGRLTGSAGGAGGLLGGAASGLSIVGDLFATAEQLPILSSAFGTLNQRFREGIKQSGGLGGAIKDLWSNASTASKAIGIASVGMLALEAATSLANKSNREAAQRNRDIAEAAGREIELHQMSAEELRDLIEQRERDIEVQQAVKSSYEARLGAESDILNASREIYEALPVGGLFGDAELTETQEDLDAVNSEIRGMRTEINDARDALVDIEAAERRRNRQLELETAELEQQVAAGERLLAVSGGIAAEIDSSINWMRLYQQGADAVEQEIQQLQQRRQVTRTVVTETFGDLLAEFEHQTGRLARDVNLQLQDQLGRDLDFREIDDITLFLAEIERQASVHGELTDAQQESIDQVQAFITETDNLNESIVELNEQWLPLAQAADDRTQQLADEEAALERSNRRLEERTALENKLADAQSEYTDFLEKRAIEETRQAERSGVEADLQNHITAAKDREAALERRQQLVKLQTETTAREKEALKKSQDERIKLTDKYQRESERDLLKFHRRLQDIEEDKNDSLFEAALDNDVAALEQSERQFDKQERREKRSFEDQASEREQQLNQELQERRQQSEQQVQEIRQQGQERVKAERETGQIVLKESQQLELELQATRDKWRQEDAMRQREAQENVHQQRIAQLAAELIGIKLLHMGAIEATKGIANLITTTVKLASGGSLGLRNTGSSSGRRQSSSANRSGRSAFGLSFADGGIVRDHIKAEMGEETPFKHELILPFKPSEGLETAVKRAGIAPPSTNVSVSAPISITGVDTNNMAALENRLNQHVQKIGDITVQVVQRVLEREQ